MALSKTKKDQKSTIKTPTRQRKTAVDEVKNEVSLDVESEKVVMERYNFDAPAEWKNDFKIKLLQNGFKDMTEVFTIFVDQFTHHDFDFKKEHFENE